MGTTVARDRRCCLGGGSDVVAGAGASGAGLAWAVLAETFGVDSVAAVVVSVSFVGREVVVVDEKGASSTASPPPLTLAAVPEVVVAMDDIVLRHDCFPLGFVPKWVLGTGRARPIHTYFSAGEAKKGIRVGNTNPCVVPEK